MCEKISFSFSWSAPLNLELIQFWHWNQKLHYTFCCRLSRLIAYNINVRHFVNEFSHLRHRIFHIFFLLIYFRTIRGKALLFCMKKKNAFRRNKNLNLIEKKTDFLTFWRQWFEFEETERQKMSGENICVYTLYRYSGNLDHI